MRLKNRAKPLRKQLHTSPFRHLLAWNQSVPIVISRGYLQITSFQEIKSDTTILNVLALSKTCLLVLTSSIYRWGVQMLSWSELFFVTILLLFTAIESVRSLSVISKSLAYISLIYIIIILPKEAILVAGIELSYDAFDSWVKLFVVNQIGSLLLIKWVGADPNVGGFNFVHHFT